MTLSTAMLNLLRDLKDQSEAAVKHPGAYTAELWVGTYGCHKATSQALIKRGLVTVGERCGFTTVTINDQGLAALAA